MFGKYRKKPVEIQAVQLTKENLNIVYLYLINTTYTKFQLKTDEPIGIIIPSSKDEMLAEIGSFIIKGVHDEFYPCDEKTFKSTYDKV
ncbi:MAG: hypothetical protein ACOC3V_00165 [bacterium]